MAVETVCGSGECVRQWRLCVAVETVCGSGDCVCQWRLCVAGQSAVCNSPFAHRLCLSCLLLLLLLLMLLLVLLLLMLLLLLLLSFGAESVVFQFAIQKFID